MMKLKNITWSFPEKMIYDEGIHYFHSEDGRDFYEQINQFTKGIEICIEPDSGIVRSISEDVSMLYPVGFSVVETDSLPIGCDIYRA